MGATRELLLPATLIVCFALHYSADQPFAVVVACALPMLLLYALAPLWAARSLASFDRDSVALLAARSPQRLMSRYRRARGMRLFAPPALLAERRAMVLLECGDARAARAAYREVLDELGAAAPARVVLGHAHASFELGDHGTAVGHYRRILQTVGALPGVERKLAHALVRRGEDLQEALTLLARTERELLNAEHNIEHGLLRALAFAKLGDSERAREVLARLGSPTPESAVLREEIARQLEGRVTAVLS